MMLNLEIFPPTSFQVLLPIPLCLKKERPRFVQKVLTRYGVRMYMHEQPNFSKLLFLAGTVVLHVWISLQGQLPTLI